MSARERIFAFCFICFSIMAAIVSYVSLAYSPEAIGNDLKPGKAAYRVQGEIHSNP